MINSSEEFSKGLYTSDTLKKLQKNAFPLSLSNYRLKALKIYLIDLVSIVTLYEKILEYAF